MPLPMLSLLAPEMLMAVMAMVLLLFGAYLKTHRAVVCIKVVAGLTLVLAALMIQAEDASAPSRFMGMVQNNAFTAFATTAIVASALIALLLSARWICALKNGGAEYSVLLLLATLGLMLMVAASNFLAFYVALELASLTMYVMASYERDHLKSTEAGIKYFVLGSLASGIMLFGISLMYGFAGSISFEAIAKAMHGGESATTFGVIVGLVLVLSALCFKMSAVPFHMWTPDVYEGAPTSVVTFFATVPKVAVVCFLIRLTMEVFGESAYYWQQILVVMALGSMLVGALAGLVQRNLKRLIAYSSIGHIGYVLLGVLAGNTEAVQAVLVYMMIYLTMSFGVFAFLLLLQKDGRYIETLDDVAGLSPKDSRRIGCTDVLNGRHSSFYRIFC
jgi:NADH-quinone oxidoreductase subunit N